MNVFFYGLFMDEELLSKKGIRETNPRKGYLNHYTLKIGQRASLVPCENEIAFGLIMDVREEELNRLYREDSVADYQPEQVEIIIDSNESLIATCYNLPPQLLSGTNESYAQSLYELAKNLRFPEDYLAKIQSFTGME